MKNPGNTGLRGSDRADFNQNCHPGFLKRPPGSYWPVTGLYGRLKLDGDYSGVVRRTGTTARGDPEFEIAARGNCTTAMRLRPYHVSDSAAVSSYHRRVEPKVVWGGVDTRVPNRKRNDGLPNYDVPVAGIQSPGTDGATFLDVVWDAAPFKDHEAFVERVQSVAGDFVEAGVYSKDEAEVMVKGARAAEKRMAVE